MFERPFVITCTGCGGTNVGIWHRTRDGEDEGAVLKCHDCGAEDGPY